MTEIKRYKPTNHLLKCMIYGGPGVGKTTLASGCEGMRTLFLAVENGLLSIAHKEPLMIEIDTITSLRETIRFLKDDSGKDYDVIVVDSISTLTDRIKASLTNNGQSQMSQKAWGELGDTLMGLFSQLLKLNKHVIFLCHEKETQDEDTGSIIYGLNIPGRGSTDVLKELDLIVRMTIDKEGNRHLFHKESFNTKTKCRSQALAALPELPLDLCEWIEIMKSGTTIGEPEVVEKIASGPKAPTENVANAWIKLEETLASDYTDVTKAGFKERLSGSKKYTDEEKQFLISMIDNYNG